MHSMGICPLRPPGGRSWRWLWGGVRKGLAPVVCEPLWPYLLAVGDTQHKARVDSKGPGSIRTCLPARTYYRKDLVFKIWILYIRNQEDFLPKCAQLVSMGVCVGLSSDEVRGGGGLGLFPFSGLSAVCHPNVISSAVGLRWGGHLTLLTAPAAGQGSGAGVAFSPGWWVGYLTPEPLVTLFFIVSTLHNFIFHILFYKKFRNSFAWIIVNIRFISNVYNIVCLPISTLNCFKST